MRNYLSFGGGVNSVALHLLMLDQGVEFESVFVHHGTDWPETYQYVAGFQWWLKSQGHRPITVLRPAVGKYGDSVLYDYFHRYKIIPTMWRRFCTEKFKVSVFSKYVEKPCFSLLGIDYGEKHRAKLAYDNEIENRWPLIEQEIDRDGCKKIILEHGLPIPMRSGCYVCPYQKKSQWIQLRKEHPCLFSRAVELEKNLVDRLKASNKKPYYLTSKKGSLESVVDEHQVSMLEEDQYPPCQCGL